MLQKLKKYYSQRSKNVSLTTLSKHLLEKKDLDRILKIMSLKINLPKDDLKSVRQRHSESLKDPFSIVSEDFQEFFEYYKFIIEKKYIIPFENEKKKLYVCNAVGHNVIYFLTLLYPDNPLFQKCIKSFKIFFLTVTKIPFELNYDIPRFYFITVQSKYHSYLTPSSKSLQGEDWKNDLLQEQKTLLKQIHQKKKIDKNDYTGSYGVYMQLVFKPLSYFGPYKDDFTDPDVFRIKYTQPLFVFDANILLTKITQEMDLYGISDERKKTFIYGNPGWIFGKKDQTTIEYQHDFLQKMSKTSRRNQKTSYIDDRNEVIFRWIIPVNLEYGCVWVANNVPYGSTYY